MKRGWMIMLLVVLAWVGSVARGQDVAGMVREFEERNATLQGMFTKKDYAAAQQQCEAMLKILPLHYGTRYNLACVLALQGKKAEAMATLTQAVADGFADTALLERDPDMATLRGDEKFAALVKQAGVNARKPQGRYEPGAELPGVRTVEDLPEGGLRYRLRISPDADEKQPAKLLVWLHPSGGSMNREVEKLSAEFNARGYALLVFTQKQYNGWSDADAKALVEKTLPAVAKIKSVDATRPVLLGYSAGGQMALELYFDQPGQWGGLLLDAAYPLAVQGGQYVLRNLPADTAALSKTPILAVVGEKDGGLAMWQKALPIWQAAGLSVQLESVPGQGHAWLLQGEVLKTALTWLEGVGGKQPGAATQPGGR
jgi:predicted esterase